MLKAKNIPAEELGRVTPNSQGGFQPSIEDGRGRRKTMSM